MKKIGNLIGQIILMMVGYFVILRISGVVSGIDKVFVFSKEQQMTAARGMLLVSFFFSSIMIYMSKRSNYYGIKFFLSILLLYFGITTFLTEIETYLFLDRLVNIIPKGSLYVLIIDDTITAVLYSLLTVIVTGKWKEKQTKETVEKIGIFETTTKIVILGIVYYFIYTLFGRFVMIPIAGHEAFTNFYNGLKLPQWFFEFQLFRGMIWVLISLPVLSMLKGNNHEKAIVLGLSYAIFMGAYLLIPMPFMPEKIRIAHLVEVITSNFVFGVIVAYVMTWNMFRNIRKIKSRLEIRQTSSENNGAKISL